MATRGRDGAETDDGHPRRGTAVELRSFITGHGQGNLSNCAELCSKKHTFIVGDAGLARRLARRSPTSPPPRRGGPAST
jgi:hypothetical protein